MPCGVTVAWHNRLINYYEVFKMTVMDGFLFGIGFLSATGMTMMILFMLLVAVEPFLRGD